MDTSDLIAVVSGVLGNLIAVVIAVLSLRRSDKALAQARSATEQGLRRADLALEQAQELARQASEAHWRVEGGATSIAWREQVFALHDRGLSPGQIRRIMHLEDGGDEWEQGNGQIDEIVRDLTRPRPAADGAPAPA
ncbi:hypothetical protein NMG29_22025 [Streptomyces cocklensis]|jgi:hypothetical protein|uniref:Uncharacterized protein n=1 Tax=Actinacidiphila cocklensis TaxID=887465 RepID=A0A9W4DXZ2_9ACTN|nr:hypothetical protein [Actinacidiphila cocklensis]MDD1060858.1 hypothetical protein [Actinacidiphila cocklensis]WSX73628.1 hypothetical protein OH826_07040 [Streptomyces sp. NBC_00899]WSX80309.1 hypothetical protein OH826_44470 [Streptomyces sp. NBC_00899]CAG6397471.1 conserved hypothetical protein [Actinacidiphila cocklensis]